MTCIHPGCTLAELVGKELCGVHYLRKLKCEPMDDPASPITIERPYCRWPSCDRRSATGSDLCGAHRLRVISGSPDMDAPIRPYGRKGCLVEGCDGSHSARGFL